MFFKHDDDGDDHDDNVDTNSVHKYVARILFKSNGDGVDDDYEAGIRRRPVTLILCR